MKTKRMICPGPFHDGIRAQLNSGKTAAEIAARYNMTPFEVHISATWAAFPRQRTPPLEYIRWMSAKPRRRECRA